MAAPTFRLVLAGLLCLGALAVRVRAETPEPAAPSQDGLSGRQLQQLATPIALYPDSLLVQVLMASTYPLEVAEAERWSRTRLDLAGAALQQAVRPEPWDPSVKSLTAFPHVLKMLSDHLDWTQKLGDAFLAQQQDVLKAVQALREKARSTGALKTTSLQTVSVSRSDGGTFVTIQPSGPQTTRVPVYSPATVYGRWPYPGLPPYTFAAQPASAWPGPGLIGFGTSVAAGAALWGTCDWPHGAVGIDTKNFNAFNNAARASSDWRHDPGHRCGAPYSNRDLARRRGWHGASQAAREAIRRGRASWRQPPFSSCGPEAPSAQSNPPAARGHAFEGLGNGEEIRRQSARGRKSRARLLKRRRKLIRFRQRRVSPERPFLSGRPMGGARFAGRQGGLAGRR